MTIAQTAKSENYIFAVSSNGLRKNYQSRTVLEEVDIRVPFQSFYVLMGENGSGKTTILKMLMNLERADNGSVEIFGCDSKFNAAQARAQIGYVPHLAEHEYQWMTCRQFLKFVSPYYPSWDTDYCGQLANAFSLQMDTSLTRFSTGEHRRLQLITALVHRPPLLLLDEPFEGLDPLIRRKVLRLLTQHLADTPTTVLITSNQIHELESLADYIGILGSGKLVAQMSREKLHLLVRNYSIETPQDWSLPEQFSGLVMKYSSLGREQQFTLLGEESDVINRLSQSGASVKDVQPLSFEDASFALLEGAKQI